MPHPAETSQILRHSADIFLSSANSILKKITLILIPAASCLTCSQMFLIPAVRLVGPHSEASQQVDPLFKHSHILLVSGKDTSQLFQNRFSIVHHKFYTSGCLRENIVFVLRNRREAELLTWAAGPAAGGHS